MRSPIALPSSADDYRLAAGWWYRPLQMEIDMKTVKPMNWTTPEEQAAWVASQLAADRARVNRITAAMTPTRLDTTPVGGGITRQQCGGGHRIIRVPARY